MPLPLQGVQGVAGLASAGRLDNVLVTLQQVADVPDLDFRVLETLGYAGGGAMPMHALPGRAIALSSRRYSADVLAHRLRTGAIRVLGRIENDEVLLELRTVADDELPALAQALRTAS
jgi:L-seryl-tRNA(Ser) seleniumtransferase